ncbi:MAG: M48 family metallopeptidase [Chitinivibrionales bacterium]
MRCRFAVLLIFSIVPVSTMRCSDAINLVSDFLVTDSQEVEMGQNVNAEIQSSDDYPLYEDRNGYNRALVRYVDSLGQLLARAQDDRDMDFYFTIIDNDTMVNAFAVPGGYVYVYTGLIKSIIDYEEGFSESMLVGVIAHEIAHITLRHGVQMMVRNNLRSLVFDMIDGDSETIRAALEVAGGLRALSYSREHEYEADSVGVHYMAEAGFNPHGMGRMLQMLVDMGGEAGIEFLSTHPATEERVNQVENIISHEYTSSSDAPVRAIPFEEGEI